MRKLFIFLFLTTLTISINAQTSRLNYKFGTGFGFMGSGDMLTISFENELNLAITRHLAVASSFGYGKSDTGVHIHSDYLMGSANLFVSPFRNDRINNFRVGVGASVFSYTSFYEKSWSTETGSEYDFYRRRTTGFNVILEDELMVGPKLLVGGKLYLTGGVAQGGILSGAMVKVGFRI
jgi:hypothetical protein